MPANGVSEIRGTIVGPLLSGNVAVWGVSIRAPFFSETPIWNSEDTPQHAACCTESASSAKLDGGLPCAPLTSAHHGAVRVWGLGFRV